MIIDWMAFSVTEKPDVVLAYLKSRLTCVWDIKNYTPGKHTKTHICGGVTVYTDAPYNDDSIRLTVSGQGCRELEQGGLVSSWPDFLSMMLDAGARFTRLDVALDDKSGLLDMDTIFRHCDEGLLTSRYNLTNQNKGKDTFGGLQGKTATFGTRGSATYIRIYDKALKENVSSHWVRVEFEARDKRAQALAEAIVKRGAGIVPPTMLNYLRFRERGTTGRKDRWPTASWWKGFLETENSFRLSVASRDENTDRSLQWLLRVVGPTFARYYATKGEALVEEMLEQGRRRSSGEIRTSLSPHGDKSGVDLVAVS